MRRRTHAFIVWNGSGSRSATMKLSRSVCLYVLACWKEVREGTDVPGGAGSGLAHIAAPATTKAKRLKAQRKQSARDKANNAAAIEWVDGVPRLAQAAAGPNQPRGKGKGKD